MNPLFRHCFFSTFLWSTFSTLFFFVLFGLILSYLVVFSLIWSYLVLFGLIWSYLVLSGLNLPYFVLFCFICCLILFYFALFWLILTLFDLIQVPVKPKKGPGRRHLSTAWLAASASSLPKTKRT